MKPDTDLCKRLSKQQTNATFLSLLRTETGVPIIARKRQNQAETTDATQRKRLSEIQINAITGIPPARPASIELQNYCVGKSNS